MVHALINRHILLWKSEMWSGKRIGLEEVLIAGRAFEQLLLHML